MRIVTRRTLRLFWEVHPTAETPLRIWFARVKQADWSGPAEVKSMFGTTVDFVADNRIVFDLGGNKFRLIVHVSYRFRRVLIKFVGTHKDYDSIVAETV
jgi:mRNA interferase HigB